MDRSPFVIHNMLEVDDARGLEGVGIQTMESAGLDELDVLDAQGLLDEAGDGDGRDAFFWGGLIANGLIPELVLPNTILAERFYREFLLWHVQSLEVLDGLHVSPAQRSVSERVFCMHFERLAYGRTRSSNAVHALRLRECGLKPADRAPSLARRQACWASAAPALPVVLDVEASRRAGEEHGCISADEQCTNMGDVGQSCSWSFGQVHSEPDRASGQGMQRLTTGLLAGDADVRNAIAIASACPERLSPLLPADVRIACCQCWVSGFGLTFLCVLCCVHACAHTRTHHDRYRRMECEWGG